MTIKMMSGKQVNFLKELIEKKAVSPEDAKKIFKEFDIKEEEDLFHLNVEQASWLIHTLIKMPNK